MIAYMKLHLCVDKDINVVASSLNSTTSVSPAQKLHYAVYSSKLFKFSVYTQDELFCTKCLDLFSQARCSVKWSNNSSSDTSFLF